ncbi:MULTISPECIES: zf-TFIIB domain-containing protein [unclassified Agrococcus]|uniref:TFIIB-type zinc ribbon-containing protein n=1 Tax=unclassified Agrococcus TaxID=2615065 RepID=UPI003605D889
MSERSGIEIDYCPQCRGIWLDRGELDKLIERSFTEQAPAPHSESWQQRQSDQQRQSQQQWPSQPGHGGQPYGQGQQGHGQQPGQGGTAAMVGKVADQVLKQVQKRSGGQQQGYGQQGHGQQGRRSWLGDILR